MFTGIFRIWTKEARADGLGSGRRGPQEKECAVLLLQAVGALREQVSSKSKEGLSKVIIVPVDRFACGMLSGAI